MLKKIINSILRLIANHTIIPKLRMMLWKLSGIEIGNDAFINMNLTVIDNNLGGMVKIGQRVSIAPNVTFINISSPNKSILAEKYSTTGKIEIGDDSWIGAGVVILPNVSIGNKVVIASNSVVTKSFNDSVIIGGSPAKILKDIKKDN